MGNKQGSRNQTRLNEALKLLRKHLSNSLRKSKRRISTRRFDDSDVVQESLIQIWSEYSAGTRAREVNSSKRPVQIECLESASHSWIRHIVFGHLAKHYRRHGAAKRSVGREESYPTHYLPGSNATPLSICEMRELKRKFLCSLGQLSGVQRLVVVRRIFEGQTFGSIADELDESRYFVRTEYKAAIKRLRAELLIIDAESATG